MDQLSEIYLLAREFAVSTNRSIFLTGKAGTGKTTFLHNLRHETKKQMAVVAPTGVAAINAGGTTMHSFFQLPFTPFVPTVEGRKELVEKIKMQGVRRKVIQELELLVIDEISMVRADVLDAVDTILRHVRYNYNQPFGGVQVIFIGDMFQLSPVAVENEWRILSPYYRSPYFFDSQVVQQQRPVYIELDKIFRQSEPQFIKVLNEVRNNQLSPEGLSLLESRYQPLFSPLNDDTYITLTTHNYKADRINEDELSKLKGSTHKYMAEINGEFPEKSYPTDHELTLKVGAKVMFIKNDSENPRRFFNGKIGIVEDMDDKIITVFCPDDETTVELERVQWENIRYSTDEKTKKINENVIGTFVQFPLRLAWAITIHKSQGLTFDKAIIDAGAAFAPGQVYVALSRCRSLEGIILWSQINPASIENDKFIVEHQQNKPHIEQLESELDASRREFRLFVLNKLFDFRNGTGIISQLSRTVEAAGSSFHEETFPFVKEILKQSQQIQQVADKFGNQLQRILLTSPIDEDFLSERLTAAANFFQPKIDLLLKTLKASPASTDSRENAMTYNDEMKIIFGIFAQKQHVLKTLKQPFNVEDYFILKNTFIMPEFQVNAYTKTGQNKAVGSRHPKLYFQLLEVRNRICEPLDLPIYLVAGSKTLLEMADYLPLSEKDLLEINGFGPSKVEKYGEQFLKVIKEYCAANQVSSRIDEKKAGKKEKEKNKKPKKVKGDSNRITFELFNAGKSIDEIAAERNLAKSTICSHLSSFINMGTLDINRFVSPEKREKAISLLEEHKETDNIYQLLSGILDSYEINFFLSWFREKKNENEIF